MCFYTVIRLVCISDKFSIFTGMGLSATLVEANIRILSLVRILAATCVPCRPMTVQTLNLAYNEGDYSVCVLPYMPY